MMVEIILKQTDIVILEICKLYFRFDVRNVIIGSCFTIEECITIKMVELC